MNSTVLASCKCNYVYSYVYSYLWAVSIRVGIMFTFNLSFTLLNNSPYVTGLGKMWIVHTSNFSTLVSYKMEWQIDVKLSGIIESLFFYHSWKFQICIPFPVVFIDLQMNEIRCVNYTHFPSLVTYYWYTHRFQLPIILLNLCLI